jgi:NTP pyrophosphatase (non-canonical NTP hydrolase)
MSDQTTSVAELRALVRRFVEERDWSQFHSPKNLSMSLAIEAAELMEHFQWLTIEASRQIRDDPKERDAVAEELADVLAYDLAMANEMDMDLSDSLRRKMIKNAEKYPVEQIRGRYGHDDRGGR